jgi:4-phospho-D-threonate 3-dehydrogenase / 4-phospho-D-erythronate 3-dehydrogenase
MPRTSTPILGITMGDPAGIGPEIIVKALAGPRVRKLCRPLVIGSQPILERTARSLHVRLRIVPVHGHAEVLGRPLSGRRSGWP